MKKNINYKIIRTLSVPAFKVCLKPTIINAEMIPKSGPILLCGNHLHVWDQFPVICATKRVTHWMAKKEYFDGKMGPFFRATGAICVDRFGDPAAATNEALNYLEHGGAVGIFPEGTRNQYEVAKLKLQKLQLKLKSQDMEYISADELKKLEEEISLATNEIVIAKEIVEKKGNKVIENEEVLPFKFGAVSMAYKTNAIIVPFGVTGDYKIGNDNLTVNFGEPFRVENGNLEKANEELRSKVLNLVRENRIKKQ